MMTLYLYASTKTSDGRLLTSVEVEVEVGDEPELITWQGRFFIQNGKNLFDRQVYHEVFVKEVD